MANKRIEMVNVRHLLRLKLEGHSNRSISSQLALDRKTVTRYVQFFDAVKAAVSLKWSNGQVEGQVNRLKNIKRQMYGRASFELLRKRVLMDSG